MNNCKICFNKSLNFFGNVKHFKYYLCSNCHTLQLSRYVSINSYSSKFEYKVDTLARVRIVKKSKLILNYIKKNINNTGRLLDIGSGYGYFLKEANKSFLYTLGLEPSLNLLNYSKNVLKVKALKQSFESFYKKNPKQKFDAITLIHVIEHIKKPKDFLKKALSLLKIGGVLYIETPNLDSLLFKAEQKKYTFLTPPEHVYIFSEMSIRYMLNIKNNKFEIKSYTYSYSEHAVSILKHFFKVLFKKDNHHKSSPATLFMNDRLAKKSLVKYKKRLFFLLFHKILAVPIRPVIDIMHKGTFLQLYIKKIR